jgi:hypothetical protein
MAERGAVMSPEEFKDKMQAIFDLREDAETQHINMDDLLCETLIELGYGEGIKIFNNARKWYA